VRGDTLKNSSTISPGKRDCRDYHKKLHSGESPEVITTEFKEVLEHVDGNLIYIRYVPVRDRNGIYLGCLEVTQDITNMKSISGKKRLLD
jgi:DUF438 domain-containing protein